MLSQRWIQVCCFGVINIKYIKYNDGELSANSSVIFTYCIVQNWGPKLCKKFPTPACMKRYWGVIIFHPRMPNFFGFVDTYEQCVNINYCEPKLSPRRWNFTSTALVGPTPGQPLATLTRSLAYYSQNRVRRRLQYFTTAYDNRTTSRRTAPVFASFCRTCWQLYFAEQRAAVLVNGEVYRVVGVETDQLHDAVENLSQTRNTKRTHNSNSNWGTCIAPPTGRPRAHHRVNPNLLICFHTKPNPLVAPVKISR